MRRGKLACRDHLPDAVVQYGLIQTWRAHFELDEARAR
jgi:hypothetical protein